MTGETGCRINRRPKQGWSSQLRDAQSLDQSCGNRQTAGQRWAGGL